MRELTVHYSYLCRGGDIQGRVLKVHLVVEAVVGDMMETQSMDVDTLHVPELQETLKTGHHWH